MVGLSIRPVQFLGSTSEHKSNRNPAQVLRPFENYIDTAFISGRRNQRSSSEPRDMDRVNSTSDSNARSHIINNRRDVTGVVTPHVRYGRLRQTFARTANQQHKRRERNPRTHEFHVFVERQQSATREARCAVMLLLGSFFISGNCRSVVRVWWPKVAHHALKRANFADNPLRAAGDSDCFRLQRSVDPS